MRQLTSFLHAATNIGIALIRISLTIIPSLRRIVSRAIDNIKMSLKCEHELFSLSAERKLIEQSYRECHSEL